MPPKNVDTLLRSKLNCCRTRINQLIKNFHSPYEVSQRTTKPDNRDNVYTCEYGSLGKDDEGTNRPQFLSLDAVKDGFTWMAMALLHDVHCNGGEITDQAIKDRLSKKDPKSKKPYLNSKSRLECEWNGEEWNKITRDFLFALIMAAGALDAENLVKDSGEHECNVSEKDFDVNKADPGLPKRIEKMMLRRILDEGVFPEVDANEDLKKLFTLLLKSVDDQLAAIDNKADTSNCESHSAPAPAPQAGVSDQSHTDASAARAPAPQGEDPPPPPNAAERGGAATDEAEGGGSVAGPPDGKQKTPPPPPPATKATEGTSRGGANDSDNNGAPPPASTVIDPKGVACAGTEGGTEGKKKAANTVASGTAGAQIVSSSSATCSNGPNQFQTLFHCNSDNSDFVIVSRMLLSCTFYLDALSILAKLIIEAKATGDSAFSQLEETTWNELYKALRWLWTTGGLEEVVRQTTQVLTGVIDVTVDDAAMDRHLLELWLSDSFKMKMERHEACKELDYRRNNSTSYVALQPDGKPTIDLSWFELARSSVYLANTNLLQAHTYEEQVDNLMTQEVAPLWKAFIDKAESKPYFNALHKIFESPDASDGVQMYRMVLRKYSLFPLILNAHWKPPFKNTLEAGGLNHTECERCPDDRSRVNYDVNKELEGGAMRAFDEALKCPLLQKAIQSPASMTFENFMSSLKPPKQARPSQRRGQAKSASEGAAKQAKPATRKPKHETADSNSGNRKRKAEGYLVDQRRRKEFNSEVEMFKNKLHGMPNTTTKVTAGGTAQDANTFFCAICGEKDDVAWKSIALGFDPNQWTKNETTAEYKKKSLTMPKNSCKKPRTSRNTAFTKHAREKCRGGKNRKKVLWMFSCREDTAILHDRFDRGASIATALADLAMRNKPSPNDAACFQVFREEVGVANGRIIEDDLTYYLYRRWRDACEFLDSKRMCEPKSPKEVNAFSQLREAKAAAKNATGEAEKEQAQEAVTEALKEYGLAQPKFLKALSTLLLVNGHMDVCDDYQFLGHIFDSAQVVMETRRRHMMESFKRNKERVLSSKLDEVYQMIQHVMVGNHYGRLYFQEKVDDNVRPEWNPLYGRWDGGHKEYDDNIEEEDEKEREERAKAAAKAVATTAAHAV